MRRKPSLRDTARRYIHRTTIPRLLDQIAPDGSQPRELSRKTSWYYSFFALRGWVYVAGQTSLLDVDLWNVQEPGTAFIVFPALAPTICEFSLFIYACAPQDRTPPSSKTPLPSSFSTPSPPRRGLTGQSSTSKRLSPSTRNIEICFIMLLKRTGLRRKRMTSASGGGAGLRKSNKDGTVRFGSRFSPHGSTLTRFLLPGLVGSKLSVGET